MNPVCVISGASQGLGFALANQYAAKGHDLVIVARRPTPLGEAAERLRQSHPRVKIIAHPADVTDLAQVNELAQKIRDQFKRVDVLINAVGQSDRGLATQLTVDRMDQLWRINVQSAVLCVQSLLPELQASRGSIINIGSLASKFAPRWLGAYAMMKHALGAWSQQLRLELAPSGVHVLLVCPGPIRREKNSEAEGDNASRYAAQAAGLPASAAGPAGGAKLKGLEPDWLADQIYAAQIAKKKELILPRYARLLAVLQAISPRIGDAILIRKTGN